MSPSKLASRAGGVWYNDIVKISVSVFGFGDARQRGRAKARLSPECSSLRLSSPARGPVAAGLQQIKG